MATLVTFHAHPDDEAIATGGVMAKYADEGHRVVLVVATTGDRGEVADGVLRPGEQLWQRRVGETHEAARILGVSRVEFLGYRDSGMAGEPSNDDPASFCRADVDEAAGRLADLLREEGADVLTVYDEHGTYGHPDHIQVHRVGVEAARLAGTPKVYEATINRDEVIRLVARARAEGATLTGTGLEDESFENLGVPEDRITTAVDCTAYIGRKRSAMAAHASQIGETSYFLTMPPELFAALFGRESFILRNAAAGLVEGDLLEGLR